MTPKEKAEELLNNLYEIHCKVFKADTSEERATRYKLLHPICIEIAILSVDEKLKIFSQIYNTLAYKKIVDVELKNTATYKYWHEVKTEIEKQNTN